MNFGNLPNNFSNYETAEIAVLPVPFDLTSSWVKGADKGPKAIIEASAHMELFDCVTRTEVYKKGIVTLPEITAENPLALFNKISEKVTGLLRDNKFVITLGGDHSVSIGTIYAHVNKYDDVTILHFDAHADFRETYNGSDYNHACVISRVQEMTDKIISVGIRSMDQSELSAISEHEMIFSHKMNHLDIWIQNIIEKSTDDVYITFDLDVLDPGIMPSTGTPEPGGLTWNQIMKAFDEISKYKNIVGFDVVELCPIEGLHAPNFLTAKLIYNLLSLIYYNKS